ncbi:RecF/RecN/SMC N-terminal domain-containing protein [Mycobacteroides abscessus subsp. massiliense]|uniref:ATP-binding protein n=1 Tax=Mycobacteroides abscessus TaxID=36809 RepID=UPI0009D34E76|nr:AAA family ATPase [Mycobacteroides abscessus]SLE05279.1 RecF/RecN/SMC N-terminal domain-containing protein [Mycobacteroides abscessus subsp. massiliense]
MRISYLEVCGFRSYGQGPERIDLTSPLTVIYGDNSQGKTSLVESFEFLYSGTTSRRILGGGSLGEFDGALRNAHLTNTHMPYVEIGFTDKGGLHTLRRELEKDYQGASDCVSTLFLDNVRIDSAEDAGFHLSDPPLSAPVLLEHALRYVVSAKPGDRSDYFKAILEVTDLEIVRAEISSLISERENAENSPIIRQYNMLRELPAFKSLLNPELLNSHTITTLLVNALNSVLPAWPGDQESDLPSAIHRVRNELAKRQDSVLPLHDLQPSVAPRPDLRVRAAPSPGQEDPNSLTSQLAEYNLLVKSTDGTVTDLLPLLRVALDTPVLNQERHDHSIDCPLCETSEALTPDRVSAIRQKVASHDGLTKSSSAVAGAVSLLTNDIEALQLWASQLTPRSAFWTEEERTKALESVSQLDGNPDLFSAAIERADIVGEKAAKTVHQLTQLNEHLRALEPRVRLLKEIAIDDVDKIFAFRQLILESLEDLIAKVDESKSAAALSITDISTQLSARSKTDGWSTLLYLAEHSQELSEALQENSRAGNATARLKDSNKKILAAIRSVLDQRLALMADEIKKWWLLIRPDELTTFNRIARRGSGNRYLDLTATLTPEPSGDGVVRNALAVLSNSQLNAIGLAAFLARCQLLNSPLIVLDDPVPGSDREHKLTFAQNIVSMLFESDRQVIVATHDAELARTLQTLHQHRGIGEYCITLLDPKEGSKIIRTGDDFERLMLDASSQMGSPLIENRRAAGNSLRIATERLAKNILIAARQCAGDTSASLSDYEGKNLSYLRPAVIAHAKAPNEPGQWATLARTLNDADHDSDPPLPAELKTCHDMLRDIKKRHGVRTQ